MKECPYSLRHHCDIWIDYQVACESLKEAEELCSSNWKEISYSNWKEISYLLDRVALLEKKLSEAGIPLPE